MRTVHWLFVLSVALFISGIGFVIAGARTVRAAPAVEAPALTPVASVKQIMVGIVGPAANVVYGAVATTSSAQGIVETAPKNDEEWAVVGSSAAALVESGNLMLTGNRLLDNGDWVTMTRAFMEQANLTLKAANAKDKDGIVAAGGDMNTTCDNCHEKYQRQ
jgi:hypothetical protein